MSQRVKAGLAVTQRHLELCDKNLHLANAHSRNDFVEKAIEFYAGFLNAQQNSDFFDLIFTGKMEAALERYFNKVTRNQYKTAVELGVISHLLADVYQLNPTYLADLKEKSEQEVQHMRGTLRIEDMI